VGKESAQPPTTVQETARPEVNAVPAGGQTGPTAESLLLDAEKEFASDPEKAQKLLEEALTLDPNNYECSLSLARLLSHRKEYAAAIGEYEHALRLDNRAAEVHYELGILYMGQAEYDSAIHSFEDSLILKPANRDDVLANLGFCHLKKGDFAQARLLLRQSLDANPENATAKAFLASLPIPAVQASAAEPPATQPPATHQLETQPSVGKPPATQPPAKQPPATQPPAGKPPATRQQVAKAPATQPPAPKPPPTETPAVQPPGPPPPQPPPKPQGAGIIAGQWDYSVSTQGGQVVNGLININSGEGDQFQMVSVSSYSMRGQDGFMHQFHEKNYFIGTLHGLNLVARCDKVDFIMDGHPAPVPGLPLQLNLVLNADGRTMQGYVSNSQGASAALYVKRR
jgi:thioredoxin-like negative regulator of GroEL